jgi:hypothetical protein
MKARRTTTAAVRHWRVDTDSDVAGGDNNMSHASGFGSQVLSSVLAEDMVKCYSREEACLLDEVAG